MFKKFVDSVQGIGRGSQLTARGLIRARGLSLEGRPEAEPWLVDIVAGFLWFLAERRTQNDSKTCFPQILKSFNLRRCYFLVA